MKKNKNPELKTEILDTYFIENRARLLDIASFLDRIDRATNCNAEKSDFRYNSFIKALELLISSKTNRTKAVQLSFSDLSAEILENAVGLKATGAWDGASNENN